MYYSTFVVLAFFYFQFSYGEIFFKEDFNDDNWNDRWVLSEWKPKAEIGKWETSPGIWYTDKSDKGLKTKDDARFYAISAKMNKAFTNNGKDLVIQYVVKNEQNIDCGGAYIKLLPKGLDQSQFGGDSPYAIMFGPDICGSTKKTHAILNFSRPKGDTEAKNMDHKSEIRCPTDVHAHLYTFIIKSDDTYEVKIDGEIKESGKLSENWPFQPDQLIQDPSKSKPIDWVDEEKIPDPEDKKPEGYDDVPSQIPDPESTKPEDWDDEDDGEWEPPMIDNPEYKGEWTPKMINNPDYKGVWKHPTIPNPDFFEHSNFHARCKECMYVGFELWQVRSGTVFDDILVTDDLKVADEHQKRVLKKIEALKKLKEEKDAAEAAKHSGSENEMKEAVKKEEEIDEDEEGENVKDEL